MWSRRSGNDTVPLRPTTTRPWRIHANRSWSGFDATPMSRICWPRNLPADPVGGGGEVPVGRGGERSGQELVDQRLGSEGDAAVDVRPAGMEAQALPDVGNLALDRRAHQAFPACDTAKVRSSSPASAESPGVPAYRRAALGSLRDGRHPKLARSGPEGSGCMPPAARWHDGHRQRSKSDEEEIGTGRVRGRTGTTGITGRGRGRHDGERRVHDGEDWNQPGHGGCAWPDQRRGRRDEQPPPRAARHAVPGRKQLPAGRHPESRPHPPARRRS